MIQDRDEYQIYFTRDDIRTVRGEDITDEQCDAIADELEGIFDDEFCKCVRNAEV